MWKMSYMSLICRKLSHNGVFFLNKFFIALFTCTFALGGAAVGAIAGAIKGHTTETGLSQGLVAGALAGAVASVQLTDLVLNGEPFHKVASALVGSAMNGEVFTEWVSPALLKAYQSQISSSRERSRAETQSDIFEVEPSSGLSKDSIKELPVYYFQTTTQSQSQPESETCTICMEKMKNGEEGRWLGSCNHFFHLHCIDQWLLSHPTCPICRKPPSPSPPSSIHSP